ncbi:MAG: EAL domain-containing protein, partial [Rhodospirillaceae bacterium]
RLSATFEDVSPDLGAPFMSVNVSGRQLSDLDEIDVLRGLIADSGVPPSRVKLEITESLMVDNPQHAAEALMKVKELGVSIAIDDFGTGYSSLSYLHQLPLDTLKIDRVFVQNLDSSESSRRITASIAQLAHALEVDIVAEGIEEAQHLGALADLGCQYGQGFHMSKPLPFAEALALVQSGIRWRADD